MNASSYALAHCNECRRETKHDIRGEVKREEPEDEDPYQSTYSWIIHHELLECRGCGNATMRRSIIEPSEDIGNVTQFPPRVSRDRPKWLTKIPPNLSELMTEVYAALDADSRALAAMGTRSVLDMVLVEKVKDVGSFQNKMKAMCANGFIGNKQADVLEAALDAGSAAAHRGHRPTVEDLNHVLGIVEVLLQELYLHPSAADDLKKSTPPRP